MNTKRLVAGCTVLSASAGALLWAYAASAKDLAAPVSASTPTILGQQAGQRDGFGFADLVQRVSPAVVTIAVTRESGARESSRLEAFPGPFGELFREYGERRDFGLGRNGPQRQQEPLRNESRGAGFIIASDGYIVTNNHVVDGGSKITVRLADGREFPAKLAGADKLTDIALLKIDGASSLPVVALADDRKVRVGDWVLAVGNPFGLGGTVTSGVVSAIHRDIGNGPYTDYIQLDASINSGNSGGPTFDMSGNVIGMNTAIFSPSGGSVGIGFAVPASTIESVVAQLKEKGSVSHGWLGVQIQTLTPDMANGIGAGTTKGAIVASVVSDSPAALAGLTQGDIILALNGNPVADSRELTRRVVLLPAGSKAEFTLLRNGKKQNVTATIGKRSEQVAMNGMSPRSAVRPASEEFLGLKLAPMSPAARQYYELGDRVSGVVVTAVNPGSDAASNGLEEGDVIVRVGGDIVQTPGDIKRAVASARSAGRDIVLMLVEGAEGQRFVTVKAA